MLPRLKAAAPKLKGDSEKRFRVAFRELKSKIDAIGASRTRFRSKSTG
jgi:hypothetical protein